MATPQISTKRIAISKANAQMVIAVGVASFVTVFCLIAAHAVFQNNQYQSKVIKEKEVAHKQLLSDLTAFNNLVTSYKKFNGKTTNVLGGSSTDSGDNDGTNSKLILDALPSSYDFPALASSLEKILSNQSFKLGGITGTDDELAQQTNVSSGTPTPTDIPFSFDVSGSDYNGINNLIIKLEHSIRPISVDTLSITGGGNDMSLSVTAHTYYQPGKSVNITDKEIK